MWLRICPSTPSRCRCSPSVSVEISLEQVNTSLTVKCDKRITLLDLITFLLLLFLNLSWGMPVRWRWHVDPHHSWSSFSRTCPHRALGLPHWQEEEPRWLPDHLRSRVTSLRPECTIPSLRIHCFMKLNTPPVPPLSLVPSSLGLCVCCSLPSSITLVIIMLLRLTCSFWTDPLSHKKGNFEIAVKWVNLFTGTLKQGLDVD